MKEYVVTITEIRKRSFALSAPSEKGAKSMAKEEWQMENFSLEQDDVKELQIDVIEKEKYEKQLFPDNIEWHKFSEQLPEDGEKIRFYMDEELYCGYFRLPCHPDEIGFISYWPAFRDDSVWFRGYDLTVNSAKITAWAKC